MSDEQTTFADTDYWQKRSSIEGLGMASSESDYRLLQERREHQRAMADASQAVPAPTSTIPTPLIYAGLGLVLIALISSIFRSISQGGVLPALFFCFVTMIVAIGASIYASMRIARSMRRSQLAQKAVQIAHQQSATALAPAGSITGTLSLNEARQLRSLIVRTMTPNPMETYQWALAKFPNASREELALQVIKAEAAKCGFIGFIAGVPGFIGLPIALPVDLFMTGRLQAAMIQTLAFIYEYEEESDAAQHRWWIVLIGGGSLARALSELGVKIVGAPILRAVPVIGAFIGYGVSYGLTWTSGKAAMQTFARKQKSRPAQVIEPLPTSAAASTESAIPAELSASDQDTVAAIQDPMPSDQPFAPVLAFRQVGSPDEEAIYCPSCGTKNRANYNHCVKCGGRIANLLVEE